MGWINGLGPYWRHLIGSGWILSVTFPIGRNFAMSDPTFPEQTVSDQNKMSWVQRPFVLVVAFHDLLTEKVVNFSLRPPAFDLLSLVKKRSQMKNMTFQWPIVKVTSWHISCSDARVERYEVFDKFYSCKMEENSYKKYFNLWPSLLAAERL